MHSDEDEFSWLRLAPVNISDKPLFLHSRMVQKLPFEFQTIVREEGPPMRVIRR